jgi:hypothetical protein
VKTYLAVGVGDMMCLDSLITADEKESISEIYWATHAGKYLVPLMDGNPAYPNLRRHHLIPDDVARQAMAQVDPNAINFWHFRPDFAPNLAMGLSLFGLDGSDLQLVDAAGVFLDPSRVYMGSSFLDNCGGPPDEDFILFHYPTSTRPRQDIAQITESDWTFTEALSQSTGLKVMVVSDHLIDVPLSNFELLVNEDIRRIVNLSKYCEYYVGCDSFCAHLAAKCHSKHRLHIKSHDPNVAWSVMSNEWFKKAFLPHPPEDVITFYKPSIGGEQ